MKKTVCILFALVLCCGVIFVPATAFANSAQREFEGVSSTGVIIKDENCPVIVTRENLVFDISGFPAVYDENPSEYNASVSAEYTFYNPADYDVNMQLVFPFGEMPSYACDYDDFSKYSAYVNGAPVTTKIRATYSTNGRFSVSSDLPKINDERVPLKDFADDTPVYKYTVTSKFTGTTDNTSRVYAKFIKGNQTLFLSDVSRYNTENLGDGRRELLLYGNSATVYSVGAKLSDDFFNATYFAEEDIYNYKLFASSNYKTLVKQIDGSTSYVESQLTVEDLIFNYYSDDLGVTQTDYYNAVTYRLGRISFKEEVNWLSNFNVNQSLLLWYQYDVSVPSNQSVVNKVVAPLYPTINDYYSPTKYYYEYYLSPATCWESFADLNITINTESFLSDLSLQGFEKIDGGYKAKFDHLPQVELLFALCESENPEYSNGASTFITVLLIIVCIVLGLFLLVLLSVIVCAIVIPIAVTRKKNNNK